MLKFDFTFSIPADAHHASYLLRAHGEINYGERVALLGPSGCGKSTFLKNLAGVHQPTRGQVSLDGSDLNQALLAEGCLGFAFQSSPLFAHLNVMDNLSLPLKALKNFRSFSQDLQSRRVFDLLERAKLTGLAQKFPSQLSGGERKRISILRALIYDPKVLLLDEPFSDLDAENRQLFKRWLLELCLATPRILLFVTHFEDDLIELATRHLRWSPGVRELTFSPPGLGS